MRRPAPRARTTRPAVRTTRRGRTIELSKCEWNTHSPNSHARSGTGIREHSHSHSVTHRLPRPCAAPSRRRALRQPGPSPSSRTAAGGRSRSIAFSRRRLRPPSSPAPRGSLLGSAHAIATAGTSERSTEPGAFEKLRPRGRGRWGAETPPLPRGAARNVFKLAGGSR